MVIVSPNVDFNESSILCPSTKPQQNLNNLSDALGNEETTHTKEVYGSKSMLEVKNTSGDMSEEESDEEILQPKATWDESVPNGPDPAVPLIPREPDAPAHRHRCSEVEHLADAAGPPPTHERRRPRATIGVAGEPDVNKIVSNHRTSVGVIEIKEKMQENARKCAYYEALLTAENTHLHNEPVDVKEAQTRPDWPKWEMAM